MFAEPKGLPPHRGFEDQIPLKPHAKPVHLRPYRYPYFHKAKVEKLVKEMIEAAIIQPSDSPFASPALLVKKKDGSWQF